MTIAVMDALMCEDRVRPAANCAAKNESPEQRDCWVLTRDGVICVESVPALCCRVDHTDYQMNMCQE